MSNLRRIPVDAARLRLRVGSTVRPVAEYSGNGDNRTRVEGAQARNESGAPLWTVDLFSMTADGIAVLRVKFPSATEPALELEAPVSVEGLAATVVQGNQYFSADQVSTRAAVKQG